MCMALMCVIICPPRVTKSRRLIVWTKCCVQWASFSHRAPLLINIHLLQPELFRREGLRCN